MLYAILITDGEHKDQLLTMQDKLAVFIYEKTVDKVIDELKWPARKVYVTGSGKVALIGEVSLLQKEGGTDEIVSTGL